MGLAEGDALVFPGGRPTQFLERTETVRAIRVADAKSCVMDAREMASHGGSLIVTDRDAGGALTLHWQGGGGTAPGGVLPDCGNGVDLRMEWSSLALLVMQAGRYVPGAFNPGSGS